MGTTCSNSVELRIAVDTEDIEILAQDLKAMHLTDKTHELLPERYKFFVGLIVMNKART